MFFLISVLDESLFGSASEFGLSEFPNSDSESELRNVSELRSLILFLNIRDFGSPNSETFPN
jgi:hypothetical protein